MAEIDTKHAGGRPPIYDGDNEQDVAKVTDLCQSFFDYIKGEFKEDEYEVEPEKFETRITTVRSPEPPTVTGLTLYLGFENKSTLYDYAKKDRFSNPIKRALTKIEQYHEIAVSMGDKCTGNIFVLKNFNWKDTQAVEHSGTVENVSPPIKVRIMKADEEDGD